MQQLLLGHGLACELAHDAALGHHQNALARGQHRLGFRGDEQHAHAGLAEFAQDLHHLFLGPDVHAARGLAHYEDLGRLHQPAGDGHLLLVAAAEEDDLLFGVGGAHAHPPDHLIGDPDLPRSPGHEAGDASEPGKGDVLVNWFFQKQPGAPGRGYVGDAAVDGAAGSGAERPACEQDAARARSLQPIDGLAQLEVARADQAVEAQDLPGAQREADVFEASRAGQALDDERRFVLVAIRGGAAAHVRLLEEGGLLAQHQAYEFLFVGGSGFEGGDLPSVAQHRDAVGHPGDLLEEMGDVDHGLARARQVARQFEQVAGLHGAEGAGGLVHDDQLGARGEGAGDLGQLMDAQRVALERFADVHVPETQFGQNSLGLAEHPPPVHHPARKRLAAQEDVLGHGQLGHDAQFLVDHGDAQVEGVARVPEPQRPAPPDHLPFVVGDDAGEDLHHRGLARAVFAHQSVHLARSHVEVDAGEGLDAAETLGDVVKF